MNHSSRLWKRHVLVDTQGFLLAIKAHAANVIAQVGARLLPGMLVGRFPRLEHLFADPYCTGPLLDWMATAPRWNTGIAPQPGNDSRQVWALEGGLPV